MAAIPRIRHILRNQFLSPIQEFIKDSRAVGIILLACTLLSIILTNTHWSEAYLQLVEREIHIGDGLLHLPHTLLHWINDGLMAFFFFLVGMEIKRELVIGELSSIKKASLPVAAALGGMIVPALIFTAFNKGTPFHSGWGIPMATDIAFSLGVASLLGSRIPVSLKIFLMALAIIDDLGAILVIALFYGGSVSWFYLLAGAIIVAILAALNKFNLNRWWVTMIGGLVLWYCIYNSGIHATIAGVVTAFLVPLDRLSNYEHKFHDPVNFIILPLFALANTAIIIPGNLLESLTSTLSWGVLAGLVIGKPLGITLFSWATIKMGWGEQPAGTTLFQLLGIGALAGIGFTMSIFITMLAFSDAEQQNISKLAILLGAVISIIAGLLLLQVSTRGVKVE
ncbi:Na+/H+ antiporter NhaA [Flavihumibacter profundi]|jgi:Na+:H+ antiporter, NhaA family|uniref:Na+/H+ antiporter NhaA n=1 Tax=Flavihumibacter profundi TaxID=2716883 RepID=UPI001CC6A807|nr:Na+/H+ antiporter NhaA [Flavihumibacter profundi]MBZ5856049.1 Na+/H+ antiporter NhaA [Flavihumibacter profundi]